MRVRRMKQAQRLNEDAKWIVGEEVDSLWDGEGSRRKRQKREHYDPVPEPRPGKRRVPSMPALAARAAMVSVWSR